MASAAEQLAASINLSAFTKATELKNRIWFTLGALVIYRLGTYIPMPGIDPAILHEMFPRNAGGILGMFDMFSGGALGRMTIFALNIMPYISASIIIQLLTAVSPHARGAEERGRERAQEAQPIHPLRHRAPGGGPGLRHRGRASRACAPAAAAVLESRPVLPPGHGRDADRRHRVPDVARRADHRARRRQRHLADHHVRHRRQPAARAGLAPGTRPHRRAVDLLHHHLPGAGGRCGRLHRVHGARAAPHPGAVSETPGRQQDVRRRGLAPAAEDQHLGRDPADLRLLAAAACRRRWPASTANGGSYGWLGEITAYLGARPAALHGALCRADRLLLLLLHRDRVQPDRDRGQSAEIRRLHPRHPAGQEHRRLSRLRADPPDHGRRRLSGRGLHAAGDSDLGIFGAVLFRRHQPADRRQRHHGHGGADPVASAGAPV